jgi:chorismate dehydratase
MGYYTQLKFTTSKERVFLIFAKIDFINLLPFYVFIKQNLKSSQQKQAINYHKSYPSIINKKFEKQTIDGAFISSIKSKNTNCTNIGIVAKKDVLSVLSIHGDYEKDIQSDTSNILAKVLNIEGKILIGDKALIYFFKNKNQNYTDLAQEWNKRFNLPFVFARLCFNKYDKNFMQVCDKFINTKVKIPQYILKRYTKRSGLTQKQILFYLSKISYKIEYKEERALKKFFKLTKDYHGDI